MGRQREAAFIVGLSDKTINTVRQQKLPLEIFTVYAFSTKVSNVSGCIRPLQATLQINDHVFFRNLTSI